MEQTMSDVDETDDNGYDPMDIERARFAKDESMDELNWISKALEGKSRALTPMTVINWKREPSKSMTKEDAFWQDLWRLNNKKSKKQKPSSRTEEEKDQDSVVKALFAELAKEDQKFDVLMTHIPEKQKEESMHVKIVDGEIHVEGEKEGDTNDFLLDSGSTCHITKSRRKSKTSSQQQRRGLWGKNNVVEVSSIGELIVVDKKGTVIIL